MGDHQTAANEIASSAFDLWALLNAATARLWEIEQDKGAVSGDDASEFRRLLRSASAMAYRMGEDAGRVASPDAGVAAATSANERVSGREDVAMAAAAQIDDIAGTVLDLFPIRDDGKNPALHALMTRIRGLSNAVTFAIDGDNAESLENARRIVEQVEVSNG